MRRRPKTAELEEGTHKLCIISMALDVTERIFAVLCVNYGPYIVIKRMAVREFQLELTSSRLCTCTTKMMHKSTEMLAHSHNFNLSGKFTSLKIDSVNRRELSYTKSNVDYIDYFAVLKT